MGFGFRGGGDPDVEKDAVGTISPTDLDLNQSNKSKRGRKRLSHERHKPTAADVKLAVA